MARSCISKAEPLLDWDASSLYTYLPISATNGIYGSHKNSDPSGRDNRRLLVGCGALHRAGQQRIGSLPGGAYLRCKRVGESLLERS